MRSRLSIFAVVAGFLFFGLLIAFGSTRPAASLRQGAVRFLRPVGWIGFGAGRWFAFGLEGLSPERVRSLQEMETRLEFSTAALAETSRENKALQRALGLKEKSGGDMLRSAAVLLYRQELESEILIIDIGRGEGTREGDPVVDGEGLLIGQVMEAGDGFSKIAVASNPGIVFSAELTPLGGRILAKGLGGRALSLELIPRDTPIRSGDFVRWVREDGGRQPVIFAGRAVGKGPAGSGGFKTGRAVLLSHPELARHVMVVIRH
jgi:cell shape-determining protein MreC